MKQLVIKNCPAEVHKKIKLYAIKHDILLQDLLIEMLTQIANDLDIEKTN